MHKFKDIVAIVVMIGCFAGAVALMVVAAQQTSPAPIVTNLLNVLLFVLSSIFAIITGYFYARIGNSEKVDTIAEQSTEKMVHVSLQLQHLKEYLSDTVEVAGDEAAIHSAAGASAYRHRVEAAADMCASLASSNETFRSDWLGVASSGSRRRIEAKYEKLREYLQDAETYERLKSERAAGVGAGTEGEDVVQELHEVEKRIENYRRELPIQPVPRKPPRPPAVSVKQEVASATEMDQRGTITITLLRPVYMATGSGKLAPQMSRAPWVSAKPVSIPAGFDGNALRVSPAAGTTFDFHIALKSKVFGVSLPVGDYVFEYQASSRPGPEDEGLNQIVVPSE